MPDALDYSRFSPPELTSAEEQRIADWEHEVAEQDARVRHVVVKYCAGWNDFDFLLLAKRALEECLDLRYSPAPLVAAYEAIDDAVDDMNRMPEDPDA